MTNRRTAPRLAGTICLTLSLALSLPAALVAMGSEERDELPAVGSAGGPSRALTPRESASWLAGRSIFERKWAAAEGLGAPRFNATSCSSCHKLPAVGGAGGLDANVIGPDASLSSRYRPGEEPPPLRNDLARASSRRTSKSIGRVLEQRQTPSLFGLGLIETIPDAEILVREDPEDRDHDGIRGIANRVQVGTSTEIGRFGWKAQMPRLEDFVRGACGGEIGLTVPTDARGFGIDEDHDDAPDPELFWEQLDELNFYAAHIAAPTRGGKGDQVRIRNGERLFVSIGCAKCHVPVLNGFMREVPLYSDLLLHDLDSARAKTAPGGTQPRLFRTAPLWGIGQTPPYMHDGRAAGLEDAIRMHGGESRLVRVAYRGLSEGEQRALLAFLRDI